MVNYSEKTLDQMVHEVMVRFGENRIPENVGWKDIAHLINRAIREVMVLSLPYKDWAYKYVMDVSNRATLPWEYLKYVRVLVSESGVPPYREARYVNPREWYTLTNWQKQQEWNKGSAINPVFTVWGVGQTPTIFIYPNTDYLSGTAPEGYLYPTANYSGKMEYYRIFDELTNAADIVYIPYQYEEIVIMSALGRLYHKMGLVNLLVETQKKAMEEKTRVLKYNFQERSIEKRRLDSFVEPVVPIVPRQPIEGEFKDVFQ